MQEVFLKYRDYLAVERNASPYTVRNYTHDLRGFFTYLASQKITSLDEVDKRTMRGYLSHLKSEGFARVSLARKLSAIRSFYSYLLREKLVASNPVAHTFSPKLDQRLPDFLTPQETVRLLEAPDLATPQGKRNRALLELLYASGLRVSELANLNLEQLNLDTAEIRVWGKGNKERMALIGQPAVNALSAYLSHSRPQLLGKKKNPAVFLNRDGGRLSERSIQRILAKYTRAVGIKKPVHPHTLRHTFATHLLDGGADLRVVQALLGHEQLSSTQIYTHITKAKAKQVYLSAHPLAQETDDES